MERNDRGLKTGFEVPAAGERPSPSLHAHRLVVPDNTLQPTAAGFSSRVTNWRASARSSPVLVRMTRVSNDRDWTVQERVHDLEYCTGDTRTSSDSDSYAFRGDVGSLVQYNTPTSSSNQPTWV